MCGTSIYGYTYETARCKRDFSGETLASMIKALRVLLYPRGGNLWQSRAYQRMCDSVS
jgi:hypothetical protein